MSKELEALEYLIENKRKHWLDNDRSDECLTIIENALKENKTLKERIILNKASFNMAKQQYEKQLKALEFIKCLFQGRCKLYEQTDGMPIAQYVLEFNVNDLHYVFRLHKEEFDLLKEVLLWD